VGWLWHALGIAAAMTWEFLWALVLGFVLSAIVHRRPGVDRGAPRPDVEFRAEDRAQAPSALGQLDEAILSLHARGMTTRDIRDHLMPAERAQTHGDTHRWIVLCGNAAIVKEPASA